MQLLVIRTEAFTHGLHGFPPPIKHQPAQIQVLCAALICSCKRPEHVVHERFTFGCGLRELVRIHARKFTNPSDD